MKLFDQKPNLHHKRLEGDLSSVKCFIDLVMCLSRLQIDLQLTHLNSRYANEIDVNCQVSIKPVELIILIEKQFKAAKLFYIFMTSVLDN